MKKMISLILALMLVVGTLAGCSGDGGESSTPQESANGSTAESAQEASEGEEQVGPEFSYPMDGTVTLTMNREAYDLEDIPEYARDYYYWEVLQEKTGIQLEMIGAASGPYDTTQEFLLLLASGEYPDMFVCNWVSFPGGPGAALNDGYIQTLDQYVEYLPNFTQFLSENPDIDKSIRTDNGELYAAPWLRQEGTDVETGLVVRKDWLDQLGMEVPTTVDEMHEVLTAFKTELGIVSPMTFELRWLWLETAAASLSSPYGVVYPYYVDDGEVKFGPLEEGYKDFIQMMADWYAEGLLDTDLATVDKSTVQAKFSNGEAGVAIQQSGNVQNCYDVLKEANEDYDVAAVPSLVMNEGDTPGFSHYRLVFDGGFEVTMSTQTEHPDVVCRFMDYLFSEEGDMLTNYGTEGVSYEADEDGNFVRFTDLISNAPNGDSPSTARYYFANYHNWAHQGKDMDYYDSDYIRGVKETWKAQMADHVLPSITHTTEETSVISAKYSTLDTYCRENITKFILGTSSMDEWDGFLDAIRSLGAEEILALKQAAYDRYMAR